MVVPSLPGPSSAVAPDEAQPSLWPWNRRDGMAANIQQKIDIFASTSPRHSYVRQTYIFAAVYD